MLYSRAGASPWSASIQRIAASLGSSRHFLPFSAKSCERLNDSLVASSSIGLEDSGVPADYVIRINIRPVLDRGVKWCGTGPREPVTTLGNQSESWRLALRAWVIGSTTGFSHRLGDITAKSGKRQYKPERPILARRHVFSAGLRRHGARFARVGRAETMETRRCDL
jgi:hypothetical protein